MPDHLMGKISAKSARWPLVLTPLLLLSVAGCHHDEVKAYRVARDQDQPQPQTAPALPTNSPNPSLPPGHPDISSAPGTSLSAMSRVGLPQLTWKTPDGWTEVPPTEMRLASFKVQGKDGAQANVSVVPLPGMAGGDDANVNRWRGQVGLVEATPDELQKMAEQVEVGNQPAELYDITGHNPGSDSATRILAVIQHHDNMTWFFKMTGDAGLVEQQKPAFVAFLKSLKFTAAQPDELPPGHPPIGGMDTNAPAGAQM